MKKTIVHKILFLKISILKEDRIFFIFIHHITCILKRVGFSLYVYHCAKICFFFFSLVFKLCFLTDQVLFKEQLISNSYERMKLEEGGPK